MTRILFFALLAATAIAADRTPGPMPNGMPFGRIGDADVDRLQDFSVKHGFDLKAEMARVYGSNGTDEDALGRVFMFARQFNALNNNARAYGQIIYSSLLNIGEHIGVPAYAKIISRQPPDVQQRIRDFLWYPVWHEHHKQNDGELESVYPGLFPKS